jgi:hypothetical protein
VPCLVQRDKQPAIGEVVHLQVKQYALTQCRDVGKVHQTLNPFGHGSTHLHELLVRDVASTLMLGVGFNTDAGIRCGHTTYLPLGVAGEVGRRSRSSSRHPSGNAGDRQGEQRQRSAVQDDAVGKEQDAADPKEQGGEEQEEAEGVLQTLSLRLSS